MKKIMTIEGMKCVHCQAKVEKALGEIAGVKNCKVNLEKKTATVSLDGEVSNETLNKAVTDVGFTPVSIEDKKGIFG